MSVLSDFLLGEEGSMDVETKSTLSPEQQALLRMLTEQGPQEVTVADTQIADVPTADFGDVPRIQEEQITTTPTIARPGEVAQIETAPVQAAQIEGPQRIEAQAGTAQQVTGSDIEQFTQSLAETESQRILSQVAQQAGQVAGATPEEREAFFLETVEQPLLEASQDRLADIGRQFSASGFFGSDREAADAAVQQDFVDALARERARFAFEGAETAATREQTGLETQLAAGQALAGQELGRQELALGAETASLQAATQVELTNMSNELESQRVNVQNQLATALQNGEMEQAARLQNELNSINTQQTNVQAQLAQDEISTGAATREAELETAIAQSNQAAAQNAQAGNQEAAIREILSNLDANTQLAIAQGNIDLSRNTAQVQADLQAWQNYASLLGVQAVENIAAVYQPTQGAGSSVLSGLAQGAGAALFSDARLKDNIQLLGEAPNGLPVYTWDWNEAAAELGHSGSGIGHLAQEVLAKYPHAIQEHNGYLAIDYSQLS